MTRMYWHMAHFGKPWSAVCSRRRGEGAARAPTSATAGQARLRQGIWNAAEIPRQHVREGSLRRLPPDRRASSTSEPSARRAGRRSHRRFGRAGQAERRRTRAGGRQERGGRGRPRLRERRDRVARRHLAVTETGDLREDEPDPVPGLVPAPEFDEDALVDERLRPDEPIESKPTRSATSAQRSWKASRSPRATNVPAKARRIQVMTRGRRSTWCRTAAAATRTPRTRRTSSP